MKIAFISNRDANDYGVWSGSLRHIYQSLLRNHQVCWLGANIAHSGFLHHKFIGSPNRYYPENYAREFGKILSEDINQGKYDIIVLRDYYLGTYLNVDIPIVYISDVTFALFKDYLNIKDRYYEYLAESTEQRLIDQVDLLLYPSEWAKKSAITHYKAKESKVHVVEFGANIPHPTEYQMEIQTSSCHLVFIGRSWTKKGGDKVLEAYRKLKSKGFACTCTLIGSVPTDSTANEDPDLTIIPFLDKSKPEHLERLCNILKTAHFLVLPTKFDAFGIVFCEASAYGVPSIAANVGGVSQPVIDGKNGFLMPYNATADDYADKIKTVFEDKDNYIKLRKSSRHEYETRLNWEIWGEKVNRLFEETVQKFKEKEDKKEKNEFYLPVYVINLKKRVDRRLHIQKQFKNRAEFKLTWIDAIEHPIGAVGLWESMVKAIQIAIKHNDDIIVICEDDHTFTTAYSKEYLFTNILGAYEQGAELLSGGVGGFGIAIPTATNRYWMDWFWSTQFIIVFRPLFQKMLDYHFKDNDTADGVLSVLAKDKMTMYPFISCQSDFGYSDVTRTNNEIAGMITKHFQNADRRLNMIQRVSQKFRIIK